MKRDREEMETGPGEDGDRARRSWRQGKEELKTGQGGGRQRQEEMDTGT
jgi:hypothetical protein